MAVPLEPAVAPIVFWRLPEPEMAARAFLEPLTESTATAPSSFASGSMRQAG